MEAPPASGASSDAPAPSRKRARAPAAPAALRPEELAAYAAAERRKGVVYLSRIPPFMKPLKVRHLLEQHAEVGRVFLATEDDAAHKRRVQQGGNKKTMFVEGWVEFADKGSARKVAELLNNTPVDPTSSGRGFYASDLWTLRFLPHFKWHHLMEKMSYEKRVRAQRLRAQLASAKKEAEQFVERSQQARTLSAMEARKDREAAAERRGEGGGGAAAASEGIAEDEERKRIRRRFKQRASLPDHALGIK